MPPNVLIFQGSNWSSIVVKKSSSKCILCDSALTSRDHTILYYYMVFILQGEITDQSKRVLKKQCETKVGNSEITKLICCIPDQSHTPYILNWVSLNLQNYSLSIISEVNYSGIIKHLKWMLEIRAVVEKMPFPKLTRKIDVLIAMALKKANKLCTSIHCHFSTQELRSDMTCHQHLTINDVSKFHQIVFLLAVQLLPTSYPYMHLSKKYFYQQTVKL